MKKAIALGIASLVAVVGLVVGQTPEPIDQHERAVVLRGLGITDQRAATATGKGRDARTVHSVAVTVLANTGAVWADAYCAPVAADPEHQKCVAANTSPGPVCLSLRLTPPQFDRLSRADGITLAEPEALGWSACPDEVVDSP
jgi:hypothetical protein